MALLAAAGAPALDLALPGPEDSWPADWEYSLEEEKTVHARALLTPNELALVASQPYMSLPEAQALFANGSSLNGEDEPPVLDGELASALDQRINYRVYITPDGRLNSRAALLAQHPFAEFSTTPEASFAQQSVGVFDSPDGVVYLVADRGTPLTLPYNLLHPEKPAVLPKQTVHTKIFLAGKAWEDFQAMVQMTRSFRRFLPAMRAAGVDPLALMSGEA
jgi:hypothetical protein